MDGRLERRRGPLDPNYWLCRCQGYQVRAGDVRLGVIEEVRFGGRP